MSGIDGKIDAILDTGCNGSVWIEMSVGDSVKLESRSSRGEPSILGKSEYRLRKLLMIPGELGRK